MKNRIIVSLAVVIGLFAVNQAYAWGWSITNWSTWNAYIWGEYVGQTAHSCRLDHPQLIKPGETKTFNAYACLLKRVLGRDDRPGGTWKAVKPYHAFAGTRVYQQYYIVGPINDELFIGRIERQ